MNDPLTHRVRASPGATALVDADTGETWRYADLDAAVEETAGRLAALGLEAGDRLGIALEIRPAAVRLIHAAARRGCVLVPLSTRLTAAELGPRIERADLAGLVCGAGTEETALAATTAGPAETATDAASTVPVASVDAPRRAKATALGEVAPRAFDLATWEPDDPSAMLYTSGTTGTPKLVVLTAGNLLASAVASAFRLGVAPGDRWLDPLPIYHMGGLAPLFRAALYGTGIVLGDGQGSFDPGTTLQTLGEYDCTGISLVPTMLRRLLDADDGRARSSDANIDRAAGTGGITRADEATGTEKDGDTDRLPGSLRFVLLGGAPTPESLVERCERRGVPVCPTYGTTETASQISTARPAEAFAHPGTVGRPLLGSDVTVVGPDGESLPVGEPGELVVSGPTVFAGYYGDPAATDAAFAEHGFHTGDAGYRDEAGRLWVLGRLDDRITTGGESVDPGEVRRTLRAHPAVCDAAVVGLPDEEYGERVAALVVTAGGADDLTAEGLRAHCRERLAGFKLPRTIAFADALPRTASGTVARRAVRERLRE
jgi:O-succinylbenzoic acid--CoA ligase